MRWLIKIKRTLRENRTFLIFLFLMFAFRSAVADWNDVPTGSMKPTIVEGDRVWINKLAYDVRLPFLGKQVFHLDDPKAGEIIVFNSKAAKKRLIKRVIGVPGDIVEMRQNVLVINGEEVLDEAVGLHQGMFQKMQSLGEERYITQHYPIATQASSFSPVRVPDGHYLVMGDNRDNSSDSRMIGFVPRGEIIGRSRHVVVSFNYENYFIPRSERFFQRL